MNSKYFLWKCDEADKPWFHSSWEYVEDFSLTMSGSGSIPRLLSSLSSFCLWNKERKIKKEKTPNYILWQLFWPNSEFSLRFWSPVAHLQGGLCNPVTCKPLSHLHCIFWEEPYHQTDVAEWSTTCMRASLTEEVLNHNPEMIWGRHHADVKKFNYPCNSIRKHDCSHPQCWQSLGQQEKGSCGELGEISMLSENHLWIWDRNCASLENICIFKVFLEQPQWWVV